MTHEAVPWDLCGWCDIASALGVSVSTAKLWAADGMPVRRFRRRVVATRYELLKWVEAGLVEPAQPAEESTITVLRRWAGRD